MLKRGETTLGGQWGWTGKDATFFSGVRPFLACLGEKSQLAQQCLHPVLLSDCLRDGRMTQPWPRGEEQSSLRARGLLG